MHFRANQFVNKSEMSAVFDTPAYIEASWSHPTCWRYINKIRIRFIHTQKMSWHWKLHMTTRNAELDVICQILYAVSSIFHYTVTLNYDLVTPASEAVNPVPNCIKALSSRHGVNNIQDVCTRGKRCMHGLTIRQEIYHIPREAVAWM